MEEHPLLQDLIDKTPAGETVSLAPGIYQGPVVINKPLILDGRGEVTVDGGGKGTIILIQADGVTLKNLAITNSGDSHDQVDAGIRIVSANNQIHHNKISNTLFGIDMKEAHGNEIIGNDISSKQRDLGLRGDGIRVWASHRNLFLENTIHDSRDMVLLYSNNNLIEKNKGWNNRYSLHFMYTGKNDVRYNQYHNNAVGIFLMYSKDSILEHNEIQYSLGSLGMGIGMKEVDNMTIRFNTIVYCAKGLYLDQSPFDPWTYNLILGNQIGYNVEGIVLHSTLKRNIFKGNALIDNLEEVSVHANGTAVGNVWQGNYWSSYEGFDRNQNGYGDSGHVKYMYLDQIWMDRPWVRFYFGSPIISVVNMLAKLLPLTEPRVVLKDDAPVFVMNSSLRLAENNLNFEIPADDEDDDEL
ncbi:MAG: nitrous oxide reductase family maturation protein NosD [SAR324 cluster bacterium]|nr:nitrous oxide reductase family maturation protein NosD [SAR324 cluster bacterium]